MRIYVCVKHVPDSAANIAVTDTNEFDESVKFVMNPYDEIAVEEALKTKERIEDSEVIVLTVGKQNAAASIRHALAMGADRGILIRTDDRLDSILTATALKAAIEQDGKPDIIFCGKVSIDSEGMQTLFRLATSMELPVATDVVAVSISVDGDRVVVEREIEAGAREIVEMSTPCVVGAGKGLNVPRYTKLMEIMKARKKEIKQVDLKSFEIDPPTCSTEIIELIPAQEERRLNILKGEPDDVVRQLVGLLKDEAKVL
ncbi:MAG TPA: electron transfer flavoprotein subunit beta/FixA family protein [Deltaproteobacteria bacterium]|nr:electron transfer flavoprotein subunit beta/FixA family protein [Deltaproteobacteria bacterium]